MSVVRQQGKDNNYTYYINYLLIDDARKMDEGRFILQSMRGCEFDINGNLQINEIIARACRSSFKITDIEYLLKVLPTRIKYPEINDNLKKYGDFTITGLVLDYDLFLISAIKSNEMKKLDYLYNTTPVNVNKIFYQFIKKGEIFDAKRLFRLCMQYKNIKYKLEITPQENNEALSNNKILIIMKVTKEENNEYLLNNIKNKNTVDWLNSLPSSLPNALEYDNADFF